MKRKNWSLGRVLFALIMAGYSGILILLLVMDWYLIMDYQNSSKEKNKERLAACVQQAKTQLDNLDSWLYNIYQTNSNFDALTREKNLVTQYGHAYEILSEIKANAALSQTMDVGVLLYDNFQKQLSHKANEGVSGDARRYLADVAGVNIDNQDTQRIAHTVNFEEDIYHILIYKRKGTAIAGACKLNMLAVRLQESMEGAAKVYILDTNRTSQSGDEWGVKEYAENSEMEFYYRAGKKYIYGQRLADTEIWIYMVVSSSLWTYMNLGQLILLAVSFLSGFAIIFLARLMKKEIVHPLQRLMEAMNRIRAGDWKAKPEGTVRFVELQKVNETMLAMVAEIEKQKMKSYEESIEKQKVKLQYLQLQLAPHFYLNSLKNINALVMVGKKEEIQELIVDFSVHLRYLMQVERELVTLNEEVDFVKNFMQLHRNMYGKKIDSQISLAPGTKMWLVPTLCIQTFAENSIKYAFSGSDEMVLRLEITAEILVTERGEFLNIMVTDNGQGYTKEVLHEINQAPEEGNRSVGINNIKRRCELIYGEDAEYAFYNMDGACNELILPGRNV